MRALLGNRHFRTVWAAAFVSGLGDKIAILAFFALVYDRTGNVADLGLLVAAQVLPGILLGPVAGVLVDRFPRHRLMIGADLLGAAVVVSIPLARTLPAVYLLAALLAVSRHVNGPARLALVPDLVGRDALPRANGLLMMSQNLILLLGMAAGGFIVQGLGAAAAFRVDGATFVASALLLLAGRFPAATAAATGEHVAATSRPAPWREALHGARTLWSLPALRFAVVFLALVTLVTAMQPPLVFDFVRRVLERGEREMGLIFAAAGLGGLLGAVLAGVMRERGHPLARVTWLVGADGALLVLFTLNRSLAGAVALFAGFGALSAALQVNLATFLQRATPPEVRGRVFGWLTPLLGPVTLLSVLVGPLLAGRAGAATVLMLAGAGELAAGLGGRILLGRRPSDRLGGAAAEPEPGATAPVPGAGAGPTAERPRAMAGEA